MKRKKVRKKRERKISFFYQTERKGGRKTGHSSYLLRKSGESERAYVLPKGRKRGRTEPFGRVTSLLRLLLKGIRSESEGT